MNSLTIAIIAGLIAMFGRGISELFAKKGIDLIGENCAFFYLNIFYLPVFSFFLLFDSTSIVVSRINVILFLILTIFDFVGGLLCFTAYRKGRMSVVNPIIFSYVVLVAVVSFFLIGEVFAGAKIIMIVFILIGVSLLSKKDKSNIRGVSLGAGVKEALATSMIYGVYIPFWSILIREGGWVYWEIASRILTECLLFVYIISVKKEKLFKLVKKKGVYWIAGTGFFQAISVGGLFWGLSASKDISVVTVISSCSLFLIVVFSFVFLKEKINRFQMAGILFMFVGFIFLALI